MANYPDQDSVFKRAIVEHLSVIKAVDKQRELLRAIAVDMATAGAPEIHSTLRRKLWDAFAESAADSLPLP
jgi:hypothetical protein